MKKKIQTITITILLTFLLIQILTSSKEVLETVSFSIQVWKDNLVPSLFPFLIISYLLTNYGISELFGECTKPFITNILHLPASCGFTLIASLLSGFPSNAKFIKNQLDKNEITSKEVNYLLAFCHFSSPLFVLGTIGNLLLGNQSLGLLILLSQYFGNLIIALLLRPKTKKDLQRINLRRCFSNIKKKISESESFAIVLKKAIYNALDTLTLLLGIITIFLIITNLIENLIPLTTIEKTFLSGILEMTQGVKNVSLLNTSSLNKALWMLSIISFGGFSVHAQILSIIEIKISYPYFLKARFLQILISNVLLFLLFKIFI